MVPVADPDPMETHVLPTGYFLDTGHTIQTGYESHVAGFLILVPLELAFHCAKILVIDSKRICSLKK